MKKEDHLSKAVEIEKSIIKLDLGTDWSLIIEGVYNITIQYIAYYCESKHRDHRDTHKGIISYLKSIGENMLAEKFLKLETLRTGRWYGGKTNGESAAEALSILDEIKRICDIK